MQFIDEQIFIHSNHIEKMKSFLQFQFILSNIYIKLLGYLAKNLSQTQY